MSKHITPEQISDLVQIDVERGGIYTDVEDFIRRLNEDPRAAQILRYQELGLFTFLGDKPQDVPAIPLRILGANAHFPLLLLVPPAKEGLLTHLGKKGGIYIQHGASKWLPFDENHADFMSWTWIRYQDGRKNCSKSVSDCRKSFAKDELGLSALQGACGYLQSPTVIHHADDTGGHVMYLHGSIHDGYPDSSACLGRWSDGVKLNDGWGEGAHPSYGSASRLVEANP